MVTLVKATPLDYNEKTYIEIKKDDQLNIDEKIVVETKRGIHLYKVMKPSFTVNDKDIVEPDGYMVRVATEQDFKKVEQNQEDAEKALKFCKRAIHEEGLDMKLVTSKYTLDRQKLIFYFTADERVDFRSLVRQLAQEFKTRIELRQIGLREKARYLGGIGPCGRSHCCSTYLGDFEPVSIQMAKNQDLSLTPTKISGACGRLMCCLSYENDYYEDARAQLPDVGEKIESSVGTVEVIGLNILDLVVRTKDKDNYIYEFNLDDLEVEEV